MARHSKNSSAKYRKQADNANKIATMIRHSKKKQTMGTTSPILDTGAKRVMQSYLELPRNQHTIMSKEKPSGSAKVLVPR